MRDLRRALAGQDRLITHQAGYRILVGKGELDAVSFRDLAARGRVALDRGQPEDAARLLTRACNLWREPPLADLPDTPSMRLTAEGLLDHWRDVREWLLDARLGLGEHHGVLEQVRAVIAADPLAEHPYVQLMLALYRCGQKSAALAAYARLRELTAREFGQDPGPEAQALLRQMLADSPDLMFQPRLSPGPVVASRPPSASCRHHRPNSLGVTSASRRSQGQRRRFSWE